MYEQPPESADWNHTVLKRAALDILGRHGTVAVYKFIYSAHIGFGYDRLRSTYIESGLRLRS